MYQLMKLPYHIDALEPYIGAKTVDIHYNRIHAGYVNRLNEILASLNYHGNESLVELINHIDQFPVDKRDDILYAASAVLNHDLYWNSMSPNKNATPSGNLEKAIITQFGSVDAFIQELMRVASVVVGSGYTFFAVNRDKKLIIINTSNQDNPYSYGYTPIMALDLWEHSYYLDDYNNRKQYISNFFSIIDFQSIGRRYDEIIQKH